MQLSMQDQSAPLAVKMLHATGALGERRYAAGQPLVVRLNGAWRDAQAR